MIDNRREIGKELCKGVEGRDNKNGFRVLRLHYTAHPDKATEEWKERTRRGMPEDKWEQEYEINYNVLHGKRFYQDFDYEKHSRLLRHNTQLRMYRGWDFGWHYPAVVFAQIDNSDRLTVLREYMGSDIALVRFAEHVLDLSEKYYPGMKWQDFCDPAGKQSTDKAEKSSVDILRSLGIRPAMKKTERELGFNIIRNLLIKEIKLPDDTKTQALLVDRVNCPVLIDGFMGGYHFPEVKDGKPQKTDPDGGGFYEHLQDALRYIIICLYRPDGTVFRNIRVFHPVRKTINKLTGY